MGGCQGSKQKAQEPSKAGDGDKTLLQQQNADITEKDQKVDTSEAVAEQAAETQEAEVAAPIEQEDGLLKAAVQEAVSAEDAEASDDKCAAAAESGVTEVESKTAVCC